MRLRRRVSAALLAGVAAASAIPSMALACSPPFEPTIRALGPAQVVVIGTTGQRVAGGRLFHVHRWFNGGEPVTPIVIAFKEGEPIGDCSYPVAAGTPLIIAPYREPDGRLAADLATLQADPTSETGRRYVAEAIALFGPGVAPPTPPDVGEIGQPPWLVIVLALVVVIGVVIVLARRYGWTFSDHD